MKHYAVAELNITEPSWIPAYVKRTTKLVEQHGGRYLARTPIAQMQAADRAECRSVARQRAISTPRDDRLKASDPDD